jgi:hypothetical protein
MPRNRSHEIAAYLSDEYHSDGGEGYGSTTAAYSRAYGRLKRAERARAAMEVKARAEANAAAETKPVADVKSSDVKSSDVKAVADVKISETKSQSD